MQISMEEFYQLPRSLWVAGAAYGEMPLEGDDCTVWKHDVVCVSKLGAGHLWWWRTRALVSDRGPAMDEGDKEKENESVRMTMEWWASPRSEWAGLSDESGSARVSLVSEGISESPENAP